jgi:hypothetical protein
MFASRYPQRRLYKEQLAKVPKVPNTTRDNGVLETVPEHFS